MVERAEGDVVKADAIRPLAGEREDAPQVGACGGSAGRMVMVDRDLSALAANGDVVPLGG